MSRGDLALRHVGEDIAYLQYVIDIGFPICAMSLSFIGSGDLLHARPPFLDFIFVASNLLIDPMFQWSVLSH